jgi:hypothetical protein
VAQTVLSQTQTLNLVASTGLLGAPTLHLTLIYNPDTVPATLDGTGVITQAVAPPGGRIDVHGIHGEVTELQFFQSSGSNLISLRGVCSEPPAMVLFPFSAVFVTDSKWNGEGSFTYGSKTVSRVPIRADK